MNDNFKKKYEEVKESVLETVKKHPLESVAVAALAMTATSKLINSVTQARSAKTWEREVRRREMNQRRRY
ncbi:hypothetical protein SEA_GOCRAZY_35 [Arthrobacter phage GoCrazy]|uniref:Uncharacterized protein n=2 Tax=Mudcatvirus TaxID=1982088 RepID=A0AAE8XN86_9CAUD|nr:hypothetical protein PQB82_gp37 [Arthrobacter phage Dynamite]YP_010666913.1 hypothetical protein PQB83_gp35 [Arthrobacter phage KeaneyLin]QFP95005.1 hypothetical protein SEA_NAPOLEONB_37 [Arthrobacter phage NapoleonB]QXO13534.1 hypothetical protein SEA_GOCRAZY_35 [Arthrobacter phage GoCrazy]UYL87300.1 hypothetical protein SEA_BENITOANTONIO_37 [Arthrobacter phage BenitoAntonio]AXH44173.1 hypothetical protein SEA_KEANEYLIN_35 [Arthrobacter phage KeaneyLin]UAW09198.1 hypothetical protein SEA_